MNTFFPAGFIFLFLSQTIQEPGFGLTRKVKHHIEMYFMMWNSLHLNLLKAFVIFPYNVSLYAQVKDNNIQDHLSVFQKENPYLWLKRGVVEKESALINDPAAELFKRKALKDVDNRQLSNIEIKNKCFKYSGQKQWSFVSNFRFQQRLCFPEVVEFELMHGGRQNDKQMKEVPLKNVCIEDENNDDFWFPNNYECDIGVILKGMEIIKSYYNFCEPDHGFSGFLCTFLYIQ